ncbi:glycosyltransferase [Eubacterium limosum]|uniref:glycosyltransferase n=1 Tax=Eubacterium limosum TaxID=1736 RepID=UPI00106249BA|nr:glycosyltransferase [Eubacterium limosum]
MKIVYVILHYIAEKDTIECVESILKSTKKSEHKTNIIIIDNGSTNGSYAEIKKLFGDEQCVTILHSDRNLGFAKGNNIGFRYAKIYLKADFIVQLNNDTILSQNNFNEIVVRKFEENKYYVLGPDIITADGLHQNPGNKQSWSFNELRLYRLKKRLRIILSYLFLDHVATSIIDSSKKVYNFNTILGDIKNTTLHGACLIFSPLYIRNFDGLYDKTFLYMEEDILKLFSDYYGFLMMYSSELSIFHKEDIATNMAQGSTNQKKRKKYKQLIESSLIYSKLKYKLEKGNNRF